MDQNDVYQAHGPEPVKAAIDDALAQPPVTPPLDDAGIVREAIQKASEGDVGAPYEPHVIEAAQAVYLDSRAEYMRLRSELKIANKHIQIVAWEREVKKVVETDEDKGMADEIVELVADQCDLFHNGESEPFAAMQIDGHRETWAVHSKGFGEWISMTAYREIGRSPSEAALRTAIATLAGKAKFDADERPVHIRVACHGGAFWIDLCDDEWRAVKVTPSGWEIVANPPVHFMRTSSMRALPVPLQGGNVNLLWDIINIPQSDQLLVLAVMLECFRADTPYPVLELVGEQGSAKSSTQQYLRELIDPNQANNRAAPKAAEDVIVAAQNSHLVSYENLSHLPDAYQDFLCVLATGGGYAKRELYTNFDESVVTIKKPIFLNGINVVATRQDLADRTVHINLPPIERRVTAGEIGKKFEAHRSSIFGGLLDQFVNALKVLPTVVADEPDLPRMADFALLGEAVYRANGKQPGDFLAYYGSKRQETVHRTLDSSPVGAAILNYLDKQPNYKGTVKGLFEVLSRNRQDGETWPRSPKGFADAFRRVAPALRLIGIHATIATKPGRDGYPCELKRLPASTPHQSGKNSAIQVHEVHDVHPVAQPTTFGEHGEQGEPHIHNKCVEKHAPAGDVVEGTL